MQWPCSSALGHVRSFIIPGDAIKRDPERENCAVLTIAAQTANSIHIRVKFNAVTRYLKQNLIIYLFEGHQDWSS